MNSDGEKINVVGCYLCVCTQVRIQMKCIETCFISLLCGSKNIQISLIWRQINQDPGREGYNAVAPQ